MGLQERTGLSTHTNRAPAALRVVTRLCPALCDPINCSPPGSTVHGGSPARMLEGVAMPSSRESAQPGTQVPHVAGGFFTEPPGNSRNTGVGSPSLLHGIFPTCETNQGLLHCRQIPYKLSYQTSPVIQIKF